MKIVLSIGLGRLHLMQSAAYLVEYTEIKLRLVCGWMPKQANSFMVRMCSKLVGRDISYGISKRLEVPQNIEVNSCSIAEFVATGLALLYVRSGLKRYRYHAAVTGCKLFGSCSRRFIHNADVFHVRSSVGQGGAIAYAKRKGIKVLVDHSMAHPGYIEQTLRHYYDINAESLHFGSSNPFFNLVLKDCLEADLLLVNSAFVRDTFLEMGYDGSKIRIATQGVRRDFFGLKNREARVDNSLLRLLFTGSFCFHKGALEILESLKLLKDRGITGITMDVVGTYSASTKLIDKYRLADIPIVFHGHVPQDSLKVFLANADVYVFPSLAEGCASSGLEAMAAGLCVVATRESGLPISDGDNGYIIPAMDAKALADKIEWLQQHPNDVDYVGVAASRLIQEEYTWECYAEKIRLIYRELCSSSSQTQTF